MWGSIVISIGWDIVIVSFHNLQLKNIAWLRTDGSFFLSCLRFTCLLGESGARVAWLQPIKMDNCRGFLPKQGYPMQVLAVDITGPFPESEAGNSYVLVVGDYFSKWVEAFAIPDQEAATVASKLIDEVYCRFSPPEQLHSDQADNLSPS